MVTVLLAASRTVKLSPLSFATHTEPAAVSPDRVAVEFGVRPGEIRFP